MEANWSHKVKQEARGTRQKLQTQEVATSSNGHKPHASCPDGCLMAGRRASGSAGAPECWVAHLAKGGVMLRALGAESSTTVRADLSCWMLVLTTARHALWIDFHDDLLLNGEGIGGAGGPAFDMD